MPKQLMSDLIIIYLIYFHERKNTSKGKIKGSEHCSVLGHSKMRGLCVEIGT